MLSSLQTNPQQTLVTVAAASLTAFAFRVVYSKLQANKNAKNKLLLKSGDVPVKPPHVWSWIPYLGSAIEMGTNVTQFIRKNSDANNHAPVFTATVLGDHCLFIADPEQLTMVFRAKYSKNLDSFSLQKQFTQSVLDCTEEETNQNFGEDLTKVTGKQFHHYLFKGEELQNSMEQVQTIFHKLIPQLVNDDDKNGSSSWKEHNLFDMVVRSIFKATMGPLLSHDIVTDEMYEQFRIFDSGVIALFNNAPSFLTRQTRRARAYLYQHITTPSFWAQASGFMKARKEAYLGKDRQLSEGTMYKSNVGLLWASVGNSAPAVFWVLLLLLEHEDAWKACMDQMETVIAKRGTNQDNSSNNNVFTLDELDEMTYLESAFTEALRLYQGNITARRVVKDFVLETKSQNYWIEKGTKIMSWWGILHRDPYVFDKPDEFQFDRFVGKSRKDFSFQDGKTLTHDPVIPFGGGEHLCPGRKFASYETRLYVAMLMQSFDIRLVPGESRPDIDPAMVGIGVCHPNRDVKVEIRRRQQS